MNVPSGYTALDLIGFTDRDDYSSTANYVKNDLVHYNGRVWKCLIDDTTGITPVEGANWTVWIDEAAYLSGLADVTITNPANGQVIRYNSQSGKWENVGVDSTPTSGSANLVQSGGVATQLANKANSADLATVATSGDYQDLNNLPTLADVATTGQYSDLLGLPTIPTVNNGTLTLQINGVTVETFNANDSNNKTANFNVPTKTSDLTNDSNFVSDANYQHITVDSAFSDTSTNPVQNKVVNSLKETLTQQINVNGSKNILPHLCNGTFTGITCSHNENGELIISGTSTGNPSQSSLLSTKRTEIAKVLKTLEELGIDRTKTYVLKSFNPYSTDFIRVQLHIKTSDGSTIRTFECGSNYSEHVIDFSQYPTCKYINYGIAVSQGYTVPNNTVLKSMFCLKSDYDLDPTYAPPAKTNQQLTKETTGLIDNQNVNGAVNMLPTDIATQVFKGATITHNSDGSYSVVKSTADSQSGSILSTAFTLKAGTYYWCASQNGHSAIGSDDCYCFIKGINGTVDWYRSTDFDVGHKWGVITLTQDSSIQFGIVVGKGTSNFTFYPMITVASYNGDYVPYAKSNKELTEDVKDTWISENYGGDTLYVTADGTKTYKTLLNELAAVILSKVQSLGSGHIMELTAFLDEGEFSWAMPLRPVFFASNASSISASFSGTSATSAESAQIKSVAVHSTYNSCYMGKTMCLASGNTFTDFRGQVPASGKKICVYYKIYRKIY